MVGGVELAAGAVCVAAARLEARASLAGMRMVYWKLSTSSTESAAPRAARLSAEAQGFAGYLISAEPDDSHMRMPGLVSTELLTSSYVFGRRYSR